MTDTVSKEKRSEIMSKIKCDNTKPEMRYKMSLVRSGMRFKYQPKLFGKPDFLIDKIICVFIDGCFWHKCRRHFKMPKTNIKFWREKIQANQKRKYKVNKKLRAMGYIVVRFWEHEV